MKKNNKFFKFLPQKSQWIVFFIILISLFFVGDFIEDYKKPLKSLDKILEKIEAGKYFSLKDNIRFFKWFAYCIVFFILCFLLVTVRWWAEKNIISRKKFLFLKSNISIRHWIFALVIVAIAFIPRYSRMNLSLWSDEIWAFTSFVWGHADINEGLDEFKRHDWKMTLYRNNRSNNHVLHSIFQRTIHDSWLKVFSKKPYEFNETILRLPVLIFGIMSLLCIFVLFYRMGMPIAAFFSIIFLSFHPNHIRYSSEARGYIILFCFVILSYIYLIRSLDRCRWRDWILFSIFQMLGLLAFSVSALHSILLNIAILLLIFINKESSKYKLQCFKRWLIVSLVTGGIYLVYALPSLIQTLRFSKVSKMMSWNMSSYFYKYMWSEFFLGTYYTLTNPNNPVEHAMSSINLFGVSVGFPMLMFFTILVLISAIFVLMKIGKIGLIFILPLAYPAIFLFYLNKSGTGVMVTAYFFTAFTISIILYSILFESITRVLIKKTNLYLSFLPIVLFMVLSFFIFYDKNVIQIKYPIENYREAAKISRWDPEKGVNEVGGKPVKTRTICLWRAWKAYDPKLRIKLKTGEGLLDQIRKSISNNERLYVFVGHRDLARLNNKNILTVLGNKELFKELPTLWGSSTMITLYPYVLKDDLTLDNLQLSSDHYDFVEEVEDDGNENMIF